MPVFGPVVTAMVTPFDQDGALDLDGAQRLADHLLANGSSTLLLVGTTGESPTLSGEEPWQLLDAVKQVATGRGTVMIGTGSNSTTRTVAATARATEEGVDGILLVTPYYNRPSQAGLIAHFTAAAAATDRPCVLYDIPGRTALEIASETLAELSVVPNIVGVKDAAGNLDKTARTIRETADAEGGFDVWCGDDALNLGMLEAGAVGFVSVSAHLCGNELDEMARLHPDEPAKAAAIHDRLLPLHRALFAHPSPGPVKGALNRLGLPSGPLRLPMVASPDEVVDDVLAALDAAGVARPS
ncbi:MAG: 4-hydroxy-tetrahydrodipicolinate synthase [Nitriliruptorales bacterium]|nr:4-hydroxy-tetrahydrodipicolinate synthase [Nitriliruptorales bacterium]